MKKIYLVLTYTGTVLSKAIKLYTKNEYSHVSISLDSKLTQLYSFGRLNPYNPFFGGFVHESPKHGTFKRFKNTTAVIYELNVTLEQYDNLKIILTDIDSTKELFKFNILGLFGVAINKKVKFKNSFYCAEFVKYVLETAGIKTNLPEIIKPEDFKNLKGIKSVYIGKLKNYQICT